MRRAVAGPVVVADLAAAVVQVVVADPVVILPAAKVVVAKVAAVVDAHPAAADKAVAAGANPVVGVHPAAGAAGWEEAVVVAVRPEVAAAEPVNSSQSSGASRICGAPFFC